jgi:hypothetical protein
MLLVEGLKGVGSVEGVESGLVARIEHTALSIGRDLLLLLLLLV